MKRKVKKFGSGGDIVTGLGAVLLGKALYDKYNESKSKDASTDSPAKTQTQTRTETKAAPPFKDPDVEVTKEVPAANKDEVRESSGRNSDLSPVEQHAAITKRSDSSKPAPVINKNKPKPRLTPKAQVDNTTQGSSTNTGVEAGQKFANIGRSKPYPIKSKPNAERESKSYPAMAAEKKKADAERRKGQGLTPYAPSGREEIMRKNRFHKEAELGYGIKKGGIVKKMASGGSVSSASKRADGIAIRGKTRA